jgi:hypothetical protein
MLVLEVNIVMLVLEVNILMLVLEVNIVMLVLEVMMVSVIAMQHNLQEYQFVFCLDHNVVSYSCQKSCLFPSPGPSVHKKLNKKGLIQLNNLADCLPKRDEVRRVGQLPVVGR